MYILRTHIVHGLIDAGKINGIPAMLHAERAIFGEGLAVCGKLDPSISRRSILPLPGHSCALLVSEDGEPMD